MAKKAGGEDDALIRWLFENSSEMLFVISPEGRYLLANPAYADMAAHYDTAVVPAPGRQEI